MRISIVVPVYNVAQYVERCVDSILKQTFQDFELILVVDGSPDECGEKCERYAAQDERILVIQKINGGLSDARNFGSAWAIANSSSEWITFIDSDDWVHPRYLETLCYAATETNCQISVCNFYETEGDSAVVDRGSLAATVVDVEKFYCENNLNAVVAWGKLYKKVFFQNVRYPVGRLHEDEFTTYKMLFECKCVAFIDEPMYNYFYNESSITKSLWSPSRLDAVFALMECADYFRKNSYREAYRYSLQRALWNIAHVQFPQLESTDIKQNKILYIRFLRKCLRRILRRGKKIKLFTFSKDKYYYELAYPRFMSYYWRLSSLVSRVARK